MQEEIGQNSLEKADKGFLSRSQMYGLFLLVLLFPAWAVVFYIPRAWPVALFSSLLAAGASFYLLKRWELKMRRSVERLVKTKTLRAHQSVEDAKQVDEVKKAYEHQIDLLHLSAAKSQEEVHQLHLEMDKKLEEVRSAYLIFEDLRKEYGRLEEEHAKAMQEAQEEFSKKDSLINEYQRTISEQRMIIEKKQRYIAKLEGKVRDLMYEIRSLLQLEEPGRTVEKEQQPLYDLSFQLQRFIEKAENLTGVDHIGYVGGKSPRFLSQDFYAVDQRPLFDRLGNEASAIVFIYSIADEKFLFVNNYVKTALGWSPEKFGKEFSQLVLSGFSEWRIALSKVASARESLCPLVIEDKLGKKKQFSCAMGMLSKGPFENQIIGLMSLSQ